MYVVQPLKPRIYHIHNPEKLCTLPKCDYAFCTVMAINTDHFPEEPELVIQNNLHILMDLYGFAIVSGIILVERRII
jgi:hypothetical protein